MTSRSNRQLAKATSMTVVAVMPVASLVRFVLFHTQKG